MKTFTCVDCGTVVELKPGEYLKLRCPAHTRARYLARQAAFRVKLKANSHAARGELNKSERSRQFALRMAAIAQVTRGEAAKLLGVSDEQIRQDEISIIMKIRKHCSGLAKECGYQSA